MHERQLITDGLEYACKLCYILLQSEQQSSFVKEEIRPRISRGCILGTLAVIMQVVQSKKAITCALVHPLLVQENNK